MIDTIIFDVGRVLVNWDYLGYLDQFSFDPEKKRRIASATFESPFWSQFDRGTISTEEILRGFLSLAPEYADDIRRVFAHCEDTITLFPYSVPWVRQLKEQGYRLYILSNYSEYLFNRTRHKMEFLPYMDGALFSYACKLVKPEREIFQLLSDRFSIAPERAVFLDDTLANTEAAKAFGLHAIHFRSLEQAVWELSALGVPSFCG